MTQSRVGDRPPPLGEHVFSLCGGGGFFLHMCGIFTLFMRDLFHHVECFFSLWWAFFGLHPPPPTKFLRAPMGDSKTDNHKDDEKHINVVIIVLHSYGGNLLVCYSSIS